VEPKVIEKQKHRTTLLRKSRNVVTQESRKVFLPISFSTQMRNNRKAEKQNSITPD
jgi:hypothetical protein